MLRFVLALALIVVVGALGYWFWLQPGRSASNESMRARTEPAAQPRLEAPPPPPAKPDTAAPDTAVLPLQDSLPPAPGVDEAVAAPLIERKLSPPIPELKVSNLVDTFYQSRGGGERRHQATDIMAPRGTPVLAMDDGLIQKLFDSKAGGLTIYLFDSSNRYCYYYAHLDRYADGLREGQFVRKATTIAYVGSTGNADINNPHLHLAVLELGPEKKWSEGNKPINPYPLLMSLAR